MSVGAGDFDADGLTDIIVAQIGRSGPVVEIIKGTSAETLGSIEALGRQFRGGVRVAAAEVNFDGIADIIAGAGDRGGSHVRIFDGVTKEKITSFAAFPRFPDSALWTAATTVVPVPGRGEE